MDGSSVPEVTHHGDREPVYGAYLFADGEDVEQCLRRMFADTVAGIEQRLPAVVCGTLEIN